VAVSWHSSYDAGTGMQDRTLSLLRRTEQVLRRLLPARDYYAMVERLYQSVRKTEAQRASWHRVNPYGVAWIETRRIRRWSRRHSQLPLWEPMHYGSLEAGDWDIRQWPLESKPWTHLFGSTVEGSSFFESMRQHFHQGVGWSDTPFIREMTRLAREVDLEWNSYGSPEQICRTCAGLDRLYADVKRDGLISFRDLMIRKGYKGPFLSVMRGEIILDITRNGEPLLVDGRHRLAIAKLLGIALVPATIAVRHVSAPAQSTTLSRPAPPDASRC
jgi:hypothetical protein